MGPLASWSQAWSRWTTPRGLRGCMRRGRTGRLAPMKRSCRTWLSPPSLPVVKCPTTRNVDLAVWASISRSRSTTMRTPTLCTRPALREGRIFRHNTGLNSNPTKRSKIRRACCAFTRSASTVRGDSMAFKMAGLVISENTIRLVCSGWRPRASTKCQLMASPSRSSSVASHTVSAFLARI